MKLKKIVLFDFLISIYSFSKIEQQPVTDNIRKIVQLHQFEVVILYVL